MNRNGRQSFSNRQTMPDNCDFEIFSYSDNCLKTVDYHHHDFYEIYYFVSGNVSYMVGANRYDLEPGELLLTRPNELHQVTVLDESPYNRMVLWVKKSLLEKLSTENTDLLACFKDNERHTNRITPGMSRQGKLLEMFERLNEIYHGGDAYGSDILRYAYLSELLVYINDIYKRRAEKEESPPVSRNALILGVIDYIGENIETNISLDMLSEKFYLSKYHLCREFKRYMGTTLHRYIVQKRLVHAKEMMEEGYTLSEVSSGCGFSDYSNFFKSFKNEYGISPKDYCIKLKHEGK